MTTWMNSLIEENIKKLGQTYFRGAFSVKTESFSDPEELKKYIVDFKGTGWCSFTDKVVKIDKDYRWNEEGFIIAAELSKNNESIHVRTERDGWVVKRLLITEDPNGEHWIFRQKFLARYNKIISYEIAWKKDDEGIWRSWNSRFVSMKEGK